MSFRIETKTSAAGCVQSSQIELTTRSGRRETSEAAIDAQNTLAVGGDEPMRRAAR